MLILSIKCLLLIWSRSYHTRELITSDRNLYESMHTFASRSIQIVPKRQSFNHHGGHYLMVNLILTSPLKCLVHLCVLISWRAATDKNPGGERDLWGGHRLICTRSRDLCWRQSLVLEKAERSFPQFSIFFLTMDLQKSVEYIYI